MAVQAKTPMTESQVIEQGKGRQGVWWFDGASRRQRRHRVIVYEVALNGIEWMV